MLRDVRFIGDIFLREVYASSPMAPVTIQTAPKVVQQPPRTTTAPTGSAAPTPNTNPTGAPVPNEQSEEVKSKPPVPYIFSPIGTNMAAEHTAYDLFRVLNSVVSNPVLKSRVIQYLNILHRREKKGR